MGPSAFLEPASLSICLVVWFSNFNLLCQMLIIEFVTPVPFCLRLVFTVLRCTLNSDLLHLLTLVFLLILVRGALPRAVYSILPLDLHYVCYQLR